MVVIVVGRSMVNACLRIAVRSPIVVTRYDTALQYANDSQRISAVQGRLQSLHTQPSLLKCIARRRTD
jgi:hypothetical protein